jgi:hypothetical protein
VSNGGKYTTCFHHFHPYFVCISLQDEFNTGWLVQLLRLDQRSQIRRTVVRARGVTCESYVPATDTRTSATLQAHHNMCLH